MAVWRTVVTDCQHRLQGVCYVPSRGAVHSPPEYKGPAYDDVTRIRKAHLNPSLVPYYKKPLLIHSGRMQYLFDHRGKTYVDMIGGIVTVSVGHCHPKVNDALKEQVDKLWHCTNLYYHPKVHEYAEELTKRLPGNLKVVYFVNSGSEANDLAVLMARLYTQRYDIVALRNCYHGVTTTTMNLTGHGNWKFNIPTVGFHHAMNADPYQGVWGGYRDSPVQSLRAAESTLVNDVCSSSDHYVKELEDVLHYSIPGKKPAAFIAEAIQGVGGTVQFPKGYLKKAFDLVKSKGGVCISDEVQTGFGRTGDHFWGFEGHGVIPDIVTMAKGIGNGIPLGAVVTTPDIANTMTQASHFNTFGGNPLSCAVGLAVLKAIDEDKLQENCRIVGNYFFAKLAKLREEFEQVGDVRGKGLMIGVEMVETKKCRAPLNDVAMSTIFETCREMGVLVGKGGHFKNVFRIKPPMCITKENVDVAVEALREGIKKCSHSK